MDRRKFLLVFGVSCILLSFLVAYEYIFTPFPRTRIVDDDRPADFHKIQQAINAANQGDTIYVKTGTYYENVIVNKTVSLTGENKYSTIIDGKATGSVVYVATKNASIIGFTIRNSGPIFPDSGILLEGLSGNNIKHNILRDCMFGTLVQNSSNNNLCANIVSDTLHGIELTNSEENILTNNIASNNSVGIYLYESDGNTLLNNTASGNSVGIILQYSSGNMLVNNKVSNAEWTGIHIDDSNGNMLLNNTASNNLDGFELTYAIRNTLANNTAAGNGRDGISVGYSDDNVLINNTVLNNANGIEIQSNSRNNSVYHNNFINNMRQAYLLVSPLNTRWDDGYPSGGNYWSDFNGIDEKSGPNQDQSGSDGIGDIPYFIDADSRDRYPLFKP